MAKGEDGHITQARGDDGLCLPVQCESDPTGLNGVVVYDDKTFPISLYVNLREAVEPRWGDRRWMLRQDQQAQGEDGRGTPVQCESDSTDLNEVVVYRETPYPIASIPCACLTEATMPKWTDIDVTVLLLLVLLLGLFYLFMKNM